MRDATKAFVGVHDFQNFFCKGTPVKSTVREIFECSVECLPAQSAEAPWPTLSKVYQMNRSD
jgi:tRNA U38,U39,U40 pseudouridine synthase TruA